MFVKTQVDLYVVERQVLVTVGKSDGSDDAGENRVGDFLCILA